MTHISVLLTETVEGLDIKPDDIVVDGTLGNGGHSYALGVLLSEKGTLIGIDQDMTALEVARARLQGLSCKVELVQDNFRNIDQVLSNLDIKRVDKVLLDLGLRSEQLDHGQRGFSFRRDEPLIMTFRDTPLQESVTAYDVVNTWSEETLADIFYGFGEERYARRIAHAIVEVRSTQVLKTTFDLVRIIEKAVPSSYRYGPIHPATRTFQAIRMAVNDEVGALEEVLEKIWNILDTSGRLAVISFHSIEDRIVKRFMREKDNAIILTKKPVVPTSKEVKENPRSRSAKLRIVQKI